MADMVVQTRVPGEIIDAVAHISSDEGESVAAWVRRLIYREINLVRLKAWVAPARGLDPVEVFSGSGAHKYLLRPRREMTPLVRAFVLLDSLGERVTTHALLAQQWYKKPSQYRFVLDRSPTPWRIVSILGEEITLRGETAYFRK